MTTPAFGARPLPLDSVQCPAVTPGQFPALAVLVWAKIATVGAAAVSRARSDPPSGGAV